MALDSSFRLNVSVAPDVHDVLSLRHLRAVNREESNDGVRIHVEPTHIPTRCPKCGSGNLHKHGQRVQEYADAPHFGRPCTLVIHRRRWRCQGCSATFPDPLPEIDEKRRATSRLIGYVRQRSLKYTFAEIGRDVGLSDVSIRHIFDDLVADLERQYEFVTPRWLGIDEVKIIGKYRCILTNVEKNTVYELLESRAMADLRKYFRHFPKPREVEVFSTDLWNNYATVAREFFPHATVVADRFHVQRMGTNGMEAVRKAVRRGLGKKERIKLKDDRHVLLKHAHKLSEAQQETLRRIHHDFPELELAWKCKEGFFAIWDAQDRKAAADAMDAWVASVPDEMAGFFREALGALNNRREHILNYFDIRVTNAYTESINRLAKSINRMGRGYSLEVVRAKLLYDTNALEKGAMVKRVPVRSRKTCDDLSMGKAGYALTADFNRPAVSRYREVKVYYGAHIPTLCEKLESGEFE